MSDHGDLHNFGQHVRSVARASGTYFQKPRPVYWEWLFFGKDSPLAPFLMKEGSEKISPRECLFLLEVEFDKSLLGHSRQVTASKNHELERSHPYSLGVLLAYCYVFGIRDLHRHNLIRTDSHLQVIDAEVVLVDLLLPNETLLLPFKDIGPELAAISLLGTLPEITPFDTTSLILHGYCDTFSNILNNRSEIQQILLDRREEQRRVPVRHIMRDTAYYRTWKTIQPEIPYSADELEQLERGDIPYFFKFIDDPKLYQYTDPTGGFASVVVPTEFAKAVARDATSPDILLQHKRVERLFPTGLLFLAKRLLGQAFQGSLHLSGTTLKQSADSVVATIGSQEYQASRS